MDFDIISPSISLTSTSCSRLLIIYVDGTNSPTSCACFKTINLFRAIYLGCVSQKDELK